LTETAELQTRVDVAIKGLRESYKKAVETVAALKKEIDDLELGMSEETSTGTDADASRLDSSIERLDAFTNSLILESAQAKRKCERLEHECGMHAFEPVRLKDLEVLCKQIEHLAKDLLCYSLGHLRRQKPLSTRVPRRIKDRTTHSR
jgi:hypothetical protein